ncbi:MAG TPA: NAD(+) diphosphatase [Microvirga sp.]|jgi:NAD+ diphosphatase|nr:NAD(+) diphosphatase [Microvirga sp.]
MKPTLGFARNPLHRHGAERDPAALERHAADPNRRIVVIAGENPVMRRGAPSTALLTPDDVARLGPPEAEVFLGLWSERPVSAALHPADAADRFKEDPAFGAADLRSIAMRGFVADEEQGLLAMAKSLLDWHRRHRFCAQCGQPTASAQAGFRRDCAGCGAQHFPRTDPVAIMLVTHGDTCLLGRQARFLPGMYSCLAGFIEPGETLEDAVRREVFEEAGVRVGAVAYAQSQPWPFPSSLMIGCVAEALTTDIAIDADELEDARWFHRDEIRLMLEGRHPDNLFAANPIAIAHHLVRGWMGG